MYAHVEHALEDLPPLDTQDLAVSSGGNPWDQTSLYKQGSRSYALVLLFLAAQQTLNLAQC